MTDSVRAFAAESGSHTSKLLRGLLCHEETIFTFYRNRSSSTVKAGAGFRLGERRQASQEDPPGRRAPEELLK